MFNLWVDYPSISEENEIVRTTTSRYFQSVEKVLSGKQIVELQDLVRRIPVADNVIEYAVHLVRRTRPKTDDAPKFIKDYVAWGCGPRASQYLILGAKTRAALEGRPTPDIEDVRQITLPVLRHRLVTNFNAEADGVTPPEIVSRLLDSK
jgi:MoxR-like ATPase